MTTGVDRSISLLWPLLGQTWKHRADRDAFIGTGEDQNKASLGVPDACHSLLSIAILSMTLKKRGNKGREAWELGTLPLCVSQNKRVLSRPACG